MQIAFTVLAAALLAAAPARAATAVTESVDSVAETARVLMAFEETIARVSRQVTPSVVYIEAVLKVNNSRKKVSGSGFVVSADGLILTNEHVVRDAQKVEVTLLGERRKYKAEVVGADMQTDVAVLRIAPDAPLLVPALGDYEKVRVGEGVLAIGNPLGLDGTVSFGIVSAKGRNLNVGTLINDFIQTDAMIDHGSSGGPLVNMRGEIIGINSRGQGRGIGFTIPINTALEVRDRYLESGTLHRGWLGVTVQPINRELADYLGDGGLKGVIVNSVLRDSPAEAAGLQTEDIILSIGEVVVGAEDEAELSAFRRAIAAFKPEHEVPVEILRNGKPERVMVSMGAQPTLNPAEEETSFGFTVNEINASIRYANRLDSEHGVLVKFVESGSVAAEAGLRAGQVIENVNGRKIETLDDFREALDDLTRDNRRFLIKARAGDNLRYHLLVPYGKGVHAVSADASETRETSATP